uniref:C2H2-type domain-containing protein n=1 Tax=Strongyloides venezuelensis TaxID=75913 RepID=A0A0K0FX77_STRVS
MVDSQMEEKLTCPITSCLKNGKIMNIKSLYNHFNLCHAKQIKNIICNCDAENNLSNKSENEYTTFNSNDTISRIDYGRKIKNNSDDIDSLLFNFVDENHSTDKLYINVFDMICKIAEITQSEDLCSSLKLCNFKRTIRNKNECVLEEIITDYSNKKNSRKRKKLETLSASENEIFKYSYKVRYFDIDHDIKNYVGVYYHLFKRLFDPNLINSKDPIEVKVILYFDDISTNNICGPHTNNGNFCHAVYK